MKKRLSFGVIILNYISYKETINCMEAFLNASAEDFDVYYAIVENGSTNKSYDVLMDKFKENSNVNVLKMEKNKGFANGNNEGCTYLREKYNCDYYIFSNSDILVPDNIFKCINKTYEKYNCDILGPDIYASKLGIHQNPIKKYSENVLIVTMKIIKKKIEKNLIKYGIYNGKKEKKKENITLKEKKIFNCPVHGSFIITNKTIFEYYNEFFDSRTFLYMEEYLLFLKCKKSNLKTMVDLDYQVIHLQGKSTDSEEKDYKQKRINRLEREIKSIMIYRNTLLNNN